MKYVVRVSMALASLALLALLQPQPAAAHNWPVAGRFLGHATDMIDQTKYMDCSNGTRGVIYAANDWNKFNLDFQWLVWSNCNTLSGQNHGFTVIGDQAFDATASYAAKTALYGIRENGSWGQCNYESGGWCAIADSSRIDFNTYLDSTFMSNANYTHRVGVHEFGHVAVLWDINTTLCYDLISIVNYRCVLINQLH